MSALSAVLSIFVTVSPLDTEDIARHVSKRIEKRMAKLDVYADKVMESGTYGEWTSLTDFPDDMVIYRYVADTLYSWYNVFSVNNDDIVHREVYQRISNPRISLASPLSKVTEQASYMNLGPNWYIVKAREDEHSKVIEGLLVVNTSIHLHGNYNVEPLAFGEGSPVLLAGQPVFKIVAAQGVPTANNLFVNYVFRWLAVLLLVTALLLFLTIRPNVRNGLIIIVLITALSWICRHWGIQLAETTRLFSPTLYANDSLMNSLGTLLIFNMSISLTLLCIYLCRNVFVQSQSGNPRLLKCYVAFLALLTAAVLFYVVYTLSSLIINSSITMDFYRLVSMSWYTLVAYFSYGFLFVCLLLCIQSAVCALNFLRGSSFNLLERKYILIYAAVMAAIFCTVSATLGFRKEQSRVMGWSNRLAVDRDLVLEMDLRRREADVATDPILNALVHINGAEQLIQRRLDEMYFGRMNAPVDISVEVVRGATMQLSGFLTALLSSGSPIGPGSNFIYTYNSSFESTYTGIFHYYSESHGMASLVIRVTQNAESYSNVFDGDRVATGKVQLPRTYSYAKYNNDHLVSFKGNYAYPTIINVDSERIGDKGMMTSVRKGYRHFVNRINDEETIVLSRNERGVMPYFVTLTYLVFLLYLMALPFRSRDGLERSGRRFFSTKMRRLVVISLLVSLVIMTTISVLFVYQRNEHNLNSIMADKISTVQIMLDGACRQMQDVEEMRTEAFVDALSSVATNTGSDISIYAADGRLFMSSNPATFVRQYTPSRISPEAYEALRFDHQRYYISNDYLHSRHLHTLYAPLFNAQGRTVAIASTPYAQMDYDFTMDAVFHAATIVSLFIILLFVTIILSSSITRSIFKPLVAMGQKMQGVAPDKLEQIEYDGNDEISALVTSYNTMVADLRESTSKLAVAERDKAWSAMARQVAHEIKNPLTPIKLEIQRLERLKQKNDPSWEEKFEKVYKVILEHIDILSQTANEFSTFAKLYSEEPVSMDLDRTLRDQVMLFGSREGVEITYLGTPDAVISGPKPQLIRVFVNLLTNAVQAVENIEGAKVVVSLRKSSRPERWDIVFEDNGPGVSAENKDKLFTPNFTTKSSGTGLGLAICRSIVDRCGGTISYGRSFALGGACFTVTLPTGVNDN